MTYGEVLGWVFLIVGGLMLSGRATTLAAALIGLVQRRPHLPPLIVTPLSGGENEKPRPGRSGL